MAHGYLKYRLKEMGLEDKVKISSAGTRARQGEKSPEFAIKAISKYKADISLHTASTLENVDMNNADYILVMTERHKKDVIIRYPALADKVKLLGAYALDKEYDEIDDPWGYNLNVYNNCAKEIVDSIEGFINKEL